MTEERLRELLQPFVMASATEAAAQPLPESIYAQLRMYLELLLRWNRKTNLTAIREPEEIVTRHFGESLFTARHLQPWMEDTATLLDVGSGAGFPGLPIQLAVPRLRVTLAESQGKKASFLREAVRTLGVHTEVWPSRVETMSAERLFQVVTLRAVDNRTEAIVAGWARVSAGGVLAELTSVGASPGAVNAEIVTESTVPGSRSRVLRVWRRIGRTGQ